MKAKYSVVSQGESYAHIITVGKQRFVVSHTFYRSSTEHRRLRKVLPGLVKVIAASVKTTAVK